MPALQSRPWHLAELAAETMNAHKPRSDRHAQDAVTARKHGRALGTKSATAFMTPWSWISTMTKTIPYKHIGSPSVAQNESVVSFSSGNSASRSLAARAQERFSGTQHGQYCTTELSHQHPENLMKSEEHGKHMIESEKPKILALPLGNESRDPRRNPQENRQPMSRNANSSVLVPVELWRMQQDPHPMGIQNRSDQMATADRLPLRLGGQ